jgi:hypothetical protein
MTALHIPTPCHETWDAMTPREGGRHCASCARTVVDLTNLRPAEGELALKRIRTQVANHAHICVRAPADHHGRLVLPSVRRRLLTNGLATVLAMVIAGDLASAADGQDPAPVPATAPTMTDDPATGTTQGRCVPMHLPAPSASATRPAPVVPLPPGVEVTQGFLLGDPTTPQPTEVEAPQPQAPATVPATR